MPKSKSNKKIVKDASDAKIDKLVEGILSATPDKRERAFFGAIGELLGGKRGRRG